MKTGDRVRVVSDDPYWLGKVGEVTGECQEGDGFWWVKFEDAALIGKHPNLFHYREIAVIEG